MRAARRTRSNIIRGGLLAGAIFSFVPAFALVRGNAGGTADSADGDNEARVGQTSSSSRDDDDDRYVPSYTLPSQQSHSSSGQSVTPSQNRSSTTTQVQPRARTRAS